MALKFLIDENVRNRPSSTIRRHNDRGMPPIDSVEVGGPVAPPLGTLDPQLVAWAEAEDRILVSLDRRTLPTVLANHLSGGGHSPGVFITPKGSANRGDRRVPGGAGRTLQ